MMRRNHILVFITTLGVIKKYMKLNILVKLCLLNHFNVNSSGERRFNVLCKTIDVLVQVNLYSVYIRAASLLDI